MAFCLPAFCQKVPVMWIWEVRVKVLLLKLLCFSSSLTKFSSVFWVVMFWYIYIYIYINNHKIIPWCTAGAFFLISTKIINLERTCLFWNSLKYISSLCSGWKVPVTWLGKERRKISLLARISHQSQLVSLHWSMSHFRSSGLSSVF